MTKPIPTLETERLVLRPFELSDCSEVQRLAGDPLIADTTLAIPHPYEEGMAEEWIDTHQPEFEQGEGVTFAITRNIDGSLIGAISLMEMAIGHRAALGYWVGRPYWNKGFCTEAGEAVLRFGFTRLDLIRIHCIHFVRNPSSGRVMQKLGMQHEGTRRKHVKNGERLEDIELYGILREDWQPAADETSG